MEYDQTNENVDGRTRLTAERKMMGMIEYPRMLVMELSVIPVVESFSSPIRKNLSLNRSKRSAHQEAPSEEETVCVAELNASSLRVTPTTKRKPRAREVR